VTSGQGPAGAGSPTGDADRRTRLRQVLDEAQQLGFLGPGPVDEQVAHGLGFSAVLAAGPPENAPGPAGGGVVIDLGSGGGLPGLVLAVEQPDRRLVLVDSGHRRTEFLEWAVEQVGLGDRVSVLSGRAEEIGRTADWRGVADTVVARSFGPPAVTAECAAPLLRVGGRLIVSEPPDSGLGVAGLEQRWPPEGLALLGLGPAVVTRDRFGYAVMVQRSPCPDRYPRRTGVPAKRPLF
jgi:16S rRNA (guanine527-N7)-methyltransferase